MVRVTRYFEYMPEWERRLLTAIYGGPADEVVDGSLWEEPTVELTYQERATGEVVSCLPSK